LPPFLLVFELALELTLTLDPSTEASITVKRSIALRDTAANCLDSDKLDPLISIEKIETGTTVITALWRIGTQGFTLDIDVSPIA
jgi:hypothetical protein